MAHDELPHMDLHCAQMHFFFFWGGGGGGDTYSQQLCIIMSDHQGPSMQKLDFHWMIQIMQKP